MLTLIFTPRNLVIGAHGKKPDILPVLGQNVFAFESHQYVNEFGNLLPSVFSSYGEYLRRNKIKDTSTIPVALGVSEEILVQEDGEKLVRDMEELLSNYEDTPAQLVYYETLGNAYLCGTHKVTTTTSPNVIVNSLGEYVTLSFNNLNGELSQFGLDQVMEFKELSLEKGFNRILDELISEFNRAGLILNEDDKATILSQIHSHGFSQQFSINKSNQRVKIQASVELDSPTYNELLTKDRSKLVPYLSLDSLNELGVEHVVLMGNYVNNDVMKSFFQEDLKLGDKVIVEDSHLNGEYYLTMIEGLYVQGVEELKKKEEEERIRREEAERKRQEILRVEAQKVELMNEIRMYCIDPNKKDEYMERYLERGQTLGLPEGVVSWNVEEALKLATIAQESSQGDLKPLFNAPVVGKTVAIQQKSMIPAQEVAQGELPKEHLRISQIFQIRGVLPDTEFLTKKIFDTNDKNLKVVRLLSGDQVGMEEAMNRFLKLYKKELKYYGELSDIQDSKDGKYYTRKYIERNTLRDYSKKIGLYNKRKFEELTSSDLRFIFQVLKEMYDLQVSHADINEENILVVPKKRWGRVRDIDIKLVGFTSYDVSKEEMNLRIHEMWGRLIGVGIYSEFREKFNL